MERFLRYFAGYVCIRVEGEQTERFLNLCRCRGIVIRKLCCCREGCLTGIVSVRDFFCLKPIRGKTGVHIRILEKHGMPFFFQRSRKRKAFFAGILAAFCLMALLSSRIWNIHVEGNVVNTTPEILEFLETSGIWHGIARRKINCSRIAAAVREQYPEITWVSVRMEGTRLLLTIQEDETARVEGKEEISSPCNLAADVEGTIVKMVTRAGVPLMKTGDSCKKGDLLVLGRIDIKNDSQEVVRYDYVAADADIYVKHEVSYYYKFPLLHETKMQEGKEKNGCFVKTGSLYLELGDGLETGRDILVEEYPIRITENFTLPLSFGRIRQKKYKMVREKYTREQAEALALRHLDDYKQNLIQKGVQISANNVKIETDYTSCVSSGTLEVVEKTGREVPAEIEQPIERTSEDGE